MTGTFFSFPYVVYHLQQVSLIIRMSYNLYVIFKLETPLIIVEIIFFTRYCSFILLESLKLSKQMERLPGTE